MGYIYVLKNKKEIVYVGQTKDRPNLGSRLMSHCKASFLFTDIRTFWCSNDKLDLKESNLIIEHRPKYNKKLPPNYRWRYVSKKDSMYHLANRKILDNRFNENILKLGTNIYITKNHYSNIKKRIEGIL